ncbi:sensor histidine kinase [Actinomadura sp. 6K520]|nr:sensor histidine kinase [Actinomadura sp. 6K520]
MRDGTVLLWVRDRQSGVAPDDAERIFERFVRGDRRDPRPAGSAGR